MGDVSIRLNGNLDLLQKIVNAISLEID